MSIQARGVVLILSDGDNQMHGGKNQNPKNCLASRASNKTPQKPWTKM